MKCAFWFSLQCLSENFLILRRIERDIIKTYVGLHVKYPSFLSGFNETGILTTDFRKISNIKFHENPSSGSGAVPCGPTDMTTLLVAFRSSANAPKNAKQQNCLFVKTLNTTFLYCSSTSFNAFSCVMVHAVCKVGHPFHKVIVCSPAYPRFSHIVHAVDLSYWTLPAMVDLVSLPFNHDKFQPPKHIVSPMCAASPT
jgi:hypothetical protein